MSDPDRLDIEMSGGCQCGAVRFHASALMANPHICHCRMCQKATGQLMVAAVGVREEHLVWTRGAPTIFMSSDYAERGFCPHCGTTLSFHFKGARHWAMAMGAFDEPWRIPIHFQIGTEGRHPALADLNGIRDAGTTEAADPAGAERIRLSSHQHPDHDTEFWP
ncbi:MAG: GFA family protein [Alphaproteobacteria bacterium]|nr:GFA family protein [Alphaproteobacteria bacterium]